MRTSGPPRAHGAHLNALLLAVGGLGAVLLFVLTVGGARSAHPASGLIAFTRSDGIYVMRADGSGVRPLRRGGVTAGAAELAWSPDGSKLAFVHAGVGDASHGIWVMNANGANLRLLAGVTELRGSFASPAWSPDGQGIAFTASTREPGIGSALRDIWVVGIDGSHERRLALTPSLWEREVDWSPAGGRIAFTSLGGYFSHMYVMKTDGSSRRLLNPGWWYEAAAPAWAPNGRTLTFMRFRSSLLSSEIWVANRKGTSRIRLTKDEIPDIHPTWSPDGRKIAFVRGGGDRPWNVLSDATEIYVVNADGSGLTRLTHNRVGEGYPAWQPVSPS